MILKAFKKNEPWSRRSVLYHIYSRSFKDSNGDGIGDIQGIIDKLDYLNDGTQNSLGIGAIWISPIYKSPMADFGYDISDYCDIDPIFGDLDTFDRLTEEAYKRDIKIVMDFVLNHTSSEHPWFLESRSLKTNPKRDWYIWRNPKLDGSPPNNWLSVFGGSAWTYDETTKQYYLHSFLPDQPDLNWRNQEVIQAMFNVLRFWMKRGVDGFRSDAIHHLMKDPEFRDEPPNPAYRAGEEDPHNALLHVYTKGHPDLFDIVGKICDVLEEYPDMFMLSEVYAGIEEMKKFYSACDTGIHAPFNFNLMHLPWDARAYKSFIDEYEASLSSNDLPNYVLGNHDRSRLASYLGKDRARTAAMLLLTLRGLPTIYNGEEIGMTDVSIFPEDIRDPVENRVPRLGLGRDPERTPLQWSPEPFAGFSKTRSWLPVAKDYKTCNIETESHDPRSILNLYRFLIHYRNTSSALLYGIFTSFDTKQKTVLAYVREVEHEKLLVFLNFSNENEVVNSEFSKGKILCSTYMDHVAGNLVSISTISLRPNEGVLIQIV